MTLFSGEVKANNSRCFWIKNLYRERETLYRALTVKSPECKKPLLFLLPAISELTVEFHPLLPAEGLLTAVCSATGKPAPNITWLDDRGLEETPQIHHIQNTNRTVTVTSRLNVSASHLHALFCLLDHPQGRQKKALHLEKRREGRLQLCGDV